MVCAPARSRAVRLWSRAARFHVLETKVGPADWLTRRFDFTDRDSLPGHTVRCRGGPRLLTGATGEATMRQDQMWRSFTAGVPEILKDTREGCRIGAGVFVAGVSGRP